MCKCFYNEPIEGLCQNLILSQPSFFAPCSRLGSRLHLGDPTLLAFRRHRSESG
ncbi:hypothetical protein HMPREF1553_01757 [Porphyromonas gingivalis F0568]|nr:hypothetical protein HMPREF1553_01757 [Porphyromonas gingivalis F0568]